MTKFQKAKICKLYGTTTIWSKGQIVIPKDARDALWLNPWDSVSFVVKDNDLIAVIPNDSMDALVEFVRDENGEFIK